MKAAIIGCGSISRIQGPLIQGQRDTEIVAVADLDIELARRIGEQLGVEHIYDDAATMIDEQKPDVVHILVPPFVHREVAVMAMDRGCHVFVEKPMALTVEDAEAMIEASKRNNVKLCVNHNAVVDDVFEHAIALARKGVVGDLVTVEAIEVYDATRKSVLIEPGCEDRHWCYQLAGGPLEDMMPHPASLILELMPEITEVRTLGLNRGIFPEGWDDELRVICKSDQVMGHITISVSEKPDVGILHIKGTKGTIHADCYNFILTRRPHQTKLPRSLRRGVSGLDLSWQFLKGTIINVFKTLTGKIDKSYGTSTNIARFYESIRTGGEPPINLDNVLRTVDFARKVWPDARRNPDAQDGNSTGDRRDRVRRPAPC